MTPGPGEYLPSFAVPADRPAYIGTIQAGVNAEGVVYRGHQWRVLDEYDETMEQIEANFPRLAASLHQNGLEPAREFVLKPQPVSTPESLEFVGLEDPISKARDYIDEGKFRQAVNWLATFMPSNDVERTEVRLLIGEAMLAEGNYEDAIERLGEALQSEPEKIRGLRLLARAHALNGDLEDALNLYQALAEILPGDTEAHLQLGYLYALRSEPARSAREFTSAFEDDLDYLLWGYPFNRTDGRLSRWITLVLAHTIRGPWASSRPGSAPMRTAWTEPGQQLIRNWGYYSNASRAKRLRESGLQSSAPPMQDQQCKPDSDEGQRQRRLGWAKMIQKVYEIDPLLCSFCGAEVKILSFIIESKTVKKILDCMGLPSQKPEPLAHSPPIFKDTVYVPL